MCKHHILDRLTKWILPVDLGKRFLKGSGFGIIVPVFFDTRTFVPSSRNLLETFVGFLHIHIMIVKI